MSQDILKQLTSSITLLCLSILIISILRNPTLFRYTINYIKKDVFKKHYFKIFFNIFIIFLVSSIFFNLAYTSLDYSQDIANNKAQNYFGEYNYSYLTSNVDKKIDDILINQKDDIKNSKLKIGVYYNISIQDHDKYVPNVSLLGLDNLPLNDNEFAPYLNQVNSLKQISVSNKIIASDNNLTKSNISIPLSLNGLDNFHGFSLTNNVSNLLIVTNTKTALKISNLKYPNTIFSDKQIDISSNTLTQKLSVDQKQLYVSYVIELKETDFKTQIFLSNSPFILLMLTAIIVYAILLYPLYKNIKNLYLLQHDKFDLLRSTGAFSGIVTKYLTYYTFLPFAIFLALSSALGYLITYLSITLLDYSFLFDSNHINAIFNPFSLLFVFTNLFSLYFLVIFLIFYSSYSPQKKFKYAKISIIKLVLGIFFVLFGIIIIPASLSLPDNSKGLIPYILVCGPITSLLALTIFLRLKNKYRRICLLIAGCLFLLGIVTLNIFNQFADTPSGVFLLGIIFVLLITSIINEYGYKDYPKLISQGLAIFFITFITCISFIGVELNTINYPFDLTVQTYTANDKSINYDSYFPKNSIISKVTSGSTIIILKDNTNKDFVSGSFSSISVDKKAITSKNLSENDLNKFFTDDSSVILSPEYKSLNFKAGDSITLQDEISNQKVVKKVFQIMDDNTNSDLSKKIIFPNLNHVFNTLHSSLNNVYIVKFINQAEQKDMLKQALNKYNIYDIQDIDQKINQNKQNSINILQSLKILLEFILVLILIFTVTRDLIKGLLLNLFIFVTSILSAFIYTVNLKNVFYIDQTSEILLIITFISVIIIYGTNITYRKIKVSK